jgi:hypothetical protein
MNDTASASSSLLRQEYDQLREILHLQPLATQRFVAAQAQRIGDALVRHATQVRFALPDQVLVADGETEPSFVPPRYRDQLIGRSGLIGRFSHIDLLQVVMRRLQDLELVDSREVSSAAKLLQYGIAIYLVHELLPAGDEVDADFETTAHLPAKPSSLPAAEPTDCFYLSQWAAVDEHDRLLVKSVDEAKACLAAMQQYLQVLDFAQTLALYIVTDDQYRQKYYGMLNQLVSQGRALARHEVKAIILEIKNRAAQHELDQGLRLNVPYFDDQALALRMINFDVTPAGRVMFVPTFVVKAAREEQIKVLADTGLSPTTRQHLLHELKLLEQAFDDGAAEQYRAWQHLYGEPACLPPPLLRVASK